MKKIFLLISIIFISCNSDSGLEKQYETIYRMQITENEKFNKILQQAINVKKRELQKSDLLLSIEKYDSLTKNHLEYLTIIENEIIEKGNEILFEGDLFSVKGIEFISKSKQYNFEIEKLISSNNLRLRVGLVFNMNDIESNNKIYINYLDYYFRGYPNVQSSFFINNMKRRALEFENEFLDEVRGKTITN
jgi:hypothetical protein